MLDTSLSLLDRLRSRADTASWRRLVDLYSPLIQGWLRRQGLQASDADDLAQEVLAVTVRELPRFQHQRPGGFRAWLRGITVNRLREFWRARRYRPEATGDSDFLAQLEQLADPASELSQRWDQDHDRHVVARLMDLVRPQFQPATWQAFAGVMLEGRSAAAVAKRLGISVNAVLLAKSRVLRRLRCESRGLID
jgi:RNA polymerase sigma-70 factor (ECF subfamily)